MKINFVRKGAFPLFYAKVPVYVNDTLIIKMPNKSDFLYDGPAKKVKLMGPGVVRNVEFDLEVSYDEITIEFKIAMGVMSGGFSVKIMQKGEVVQKLRKTY